LSYFQTEQPNKYVKAAQIGFDVTLKPGSPFTPDAPDGPGGPTLPGSPGNPSVPRSPLSPGGPDIYKHLIYTLPSYQTEFEIATHLQNLNH